MTATKSVGIIQPNYVPWRGYFDFINSVDVFVFHDDLQYTKGDWRNRNRIRTTSGPSIWLTVPVSANSDTMIRDARIDTAQDWARKHLAMLEANYRTAPYYQSYIGGLREILTAGHETISSLDIALTLKISEWLGIDTKFVVSSEMDVDGYRDTKLMALIRAVGGTRYVSGPAAKAYIQPELWFEAGIELAYFDYPHYPSYPQVSDPYDPAVSVLDLLFMTGPEAPDHIWPDGLAARHKLVDRTKCGALT